MVSLTAAYFGGNPCGEPPRRVGGQHVDHAWQRAATRRAALQLALALNLSLSTWSVLGPQMIWLMAMGTLMANAMAGAVSPFPRWPGRRHLSRASP